MDIERSTTRTNLIKFELRREMYRLLEEALEAAGVRNDYREPLADRGDGILALVHAVDEIPRSRLLHPLIPVLTWLLTEHNQALDPAEAALRELRLRAVVHAGDLLQDDHGPFGAELDAAFRLLDSRALKACLRQAAAPLVLVVSDPIYESVVVHGHDGISPAVFRRAVRTEVCGMRRYGWIHVPEIPRRPAPAIGASPLRPALAEPETVPALHP